MKDRSFLPFKARPVQAINLTTVLTALLYGPAIAQGALTAPMELEGFETPVFAPQDFKYSPSGSAWTFSGSSGSGIQRNESAWGAATAPQGQQTAFLQGGDAHISKIVALPAGVYNVSFYAARRKYGRHVANPIQVKIAGTPVGKPIAPTDTAFAKYTTSDFPLSTTGNYKVELVSTNGEPGDYSSFVDAVAINPVTTASMSPPGANFQASSPGFTAPNRPLEVTVGMVTHSGYNANYSVTTNQPAQCRATSGTGNAFGALYGDLTSSPDGLAHTKSMVLGHPGAQITYVVCKATSPTEETEVAIPIN